MMSGDVPSKTGTHVLTRNQTALLTWAVAYPLITSLLLLLDPLVGGLALPLRTFALTALMVPIMVYWAVPAAIRQVTRRLGARLS